MEPRRAAGAASPQGVRSSDSTRRAAPGQAGAAEGVEHRGGVLALRVGVQVAEEKEEELTF